MDSKNFLGNGMKFPPQINKATGRFEMSFGEQSVKESVYLILMTQKGERWLRPGFGSEIMTYTFLDVNNTMLNIIRSDIKSCIVQNEPRVSNVDVFLDAQSKPGYLIIDVEYTVSASNARDNLVFPFFLNNGQNEEVTNEIVEKV